MFKLPDDKANIKYEMALLEVIGSNGRLLNSEEIERYVVLEQRLQDIEATEQIMEAVYEVWR